ncbi:MAG: WD40 repeat domain-containing protein [Methyloligellaceae bacterium]
MADQLRERFGRPNAHILISIDQAEELFSIADPGDSEQFLDVLGAILDDDMPYVGMAALRPDFLEDFQTSDQLSHVVEEFSPRLMPLSAIRDIITSPAKLINAEIEDDLVEAILSDALQEGALPLVAIVLRYLYDRSDNNLLTLAEYQAIGNHYAGKTPLGNIIAKLAEEILETENPDAGQLAMLEDVFAGKMVWRDNDNRFVSSPVPLEELNLKTRGYIRKFIEAGLLVQVQVDDQEMVEFAHLSILDYWPRLGEWVQSSHGGGNMDAALTETVQPQLTYTGDTGTEAIEPDEIASPREFTFQPEKDGESGFIEEAHDYVHGEILEPNKYANGVDDHVEEDRISKAPSIFADQEERFSKATLSDRNDTSTYKEDYREETDVMDVPDMFTRDDKYETEKNIAVADPKRNYSYENPDYDSAGYGDELPRRKGKLKYLLAAVVLGGALAAGVVFWPQLEPHVAKLKDTVQKATGKSVDTADVPVVRKDGKEEETAKADTDTEVKKETEDKTAEVAEKTTEPVETATAPDVDPRLVGQELNKSWAFLNMVSSFELLNDKSADKALRIKALGDMSRNLQKMRSSLILKGHTAPVRHVSFSPDSIYIVSASEDKTIKIWDLLTGNAVLTLKGHTGPVNSVAFSPDGKSILSSSDDGTARIWDAENGNSIRTFEGHEKAVKFAAFDSTGERLATASSDKSVKVWTVADGKEQFTLTGHEAAVSSVAFSKNGSWIASASQDQTARIWDAASGQQILVLNGHKGGVRTVKFSNDGNTVLTGSEDQTLILWHTFSGKRVNTFVGHLDGVMSADFSPDENVIISTSLDGKAVLWDRVRGSLMSNIRGRTDGVRNAVFDKTGEWIVSASKANDIHLLPAQFYLTSKLFEGHTDRVFSSVFGQDGEFVLTASRDSTARLWNVESNAQVMIFTGHLGQIHHGAFSPDQATIATASKDQTVRLWDRKSGREKKQLTGATGAVNRIAYNPDGTLIVGASQDKNVYLWDAQTGNIVYILKGHEGAVWSVLFSPDGSKIFSSSEDKTIRVWDTQSGELKNEFKGHKASILALALNEEGTLLASGSADKTVKFWDLEKGEATGKTLQDKSFITSVGFSSDGKKVITGSFNKRALIWDRASGKVIWELNDHEDRVMSVGFSEDNNWALTASSDKAYMWRVFSTPEMMFYVKAVMPRCLIGEERKKLGFGEEVPDWCKAIEELKKRN